MKSLETQKINQDKKEEEQKQDKKQKTIEWHYPYIWIALPRTGNIS